MTTQNDIMTLVHNIIKSSPIAALSGGIYKRIRPTESKLEDCVINVISGVVGQFVQDGAISVKIFYSDILSGNTYYEDTVNGAAKERLLYDLSESLLSNTALISFSRNSREIIIEPVQSVYGSSSNSHEHYAILKMNFKTTTN